MALRSPRHRAGVLGAVAVAAALGLSACGGGTDTAGGGESKAPAVSADQAIAAKVPQNIKADGKLIVGSDGSYPPNENIAADGVSFEGWDVELATAVAAKMGLKAEFQNAGFDTIIPGVQSGKYEMGVSSFTDNAEREKVVDFVTYYSAGTSWAAQKGNPKQVDPNNACGKNIGVQQGTVQHTDDLPTRSEACTKAGKPKINMIPRKNQTEVNADIVAGKVDAMAADSPIVGYAIKQTSGQLQMLGQVYDAAPYGYAIGKESGTMKDAVLDAVKALMADGTYKKILDKWGVADGAITDPVINGAQD
ncbi:MAG: transporter substrate-binding domain-containing protein [Streptosporangiales bacterium]|nr:transporter substrate-binding domain-containing protein [Streptosporangiales bacterium]